MPLLGGLAMFVGFAAAMLLFLPERRDARTASRWFGVLIVSALAAVLLVADDRWSLPPLTKFGLQLLIALVAVLAFGKEFQITFISLPGAGIIQLRAGWPSRSACSGCSACRTRSTCWTASTGWRRAW